MRDVEERIREGLSSEVERFRHRDRASFGPPRLAPRTRRKVRRRQIGTVVLSLALAAGLAVGGIQAVDAFHSGHAVTPGENQTPTTGPQQAPPGWPVVHFGAGDRPTVVPPEKKLVAFGTVTFAARRLQWSLVAYRQPAADSPTGRAELCTQFNELEAGRGGGGGTGCGPRPAGARSSPPRYISLGSDSGSGLSIAAYEGLLNGDVARAQVIIGRSRSFDLRIVPGPAGFGVKYFVFYAPLHTAGEIFLYDSDGDFLQRETFCHLVVPQGRGLSGGGSAFGGGGTTTVSGTTGTTSSEGTVSGVGSTSTTSGSTGTTPRGRSVTLVPGGVATSTSTGAATVTAGGPPASAGVTGSTTGYCA